MLSFEAVWPIWYNIYLVRCLLNQETMLRQIHRWIPVDPVLRAMRYARLPAIDHVLQDVLAYSNRFASGIPIETPNALPPRRVI